MALQRAMADGTEAPCHKCGGEFMPMSMKVKRPSHKPGVPGTFTVGGSYYVWVHEKCSPTKLKNHSRIKSKK